MTFGKSRFFVDKTAVDKTVSQKKVDKTGSPNQNTQISGIPPVELPVKFFFSKKVLGNSFVLEETLLAKNCQKTTQLLTLA